MTIPEVIEFMEVDHDRDQQLKAVIRGLKLVDYRQPYSQAEVALLACTPQPTISNIENGKIKGVSYSVLLRVLKAYVKLRELHAKHNMATAPRSSDEDRTQDGSGS